MTGDCPVCGGSLLRGGMSGQPHTQEYHEGVRRRLLRAVTTLMRREARARLRGAQAAVRGGVSLRWRSGALRGPGNEFWTDVPAELVADWEKDPASRSDSMWALRASLADHVARVYRTEVNPATFTCRVYE